MPEDHQATLINIADGTQYLLSDLTIFGRKSDSAIHLADTRVSRRHAMIRSQEGGQYWFYDLGSFNGSYINNERVTATRQLEANDVIRICDHEFRFMMMVPGQQVHTSELDVQTVPMLILVSDIKGFTRLSEMIPHEELAQAIGSWYDYCTEILTEHGAAIDKFIGDAVLAYWTDTSANARKWAVMAARELRRGCEEIGHQLRYTFERHGAEFASGVGLHAGDVAYGQFGQGGLTMPILSGMLHGCSITSRYMSQTCSVPSGAFAKFTTRTQVSVLAANSRFNSSAGRRPSRLTPESEMIFR